MATLDRSVQNSIRVVNMTHAYIRDPRLLPFVDQSNYFHLKKKGHTSEKTPIKVSDIHCVLGSLVPDLLKAEIMPAAIQYAP